MTIEIINHHGGGLGAEQTTIFDHIRRKLQYIAELIDIWSLPLPDWFDRITTAL